MKLASLRHDGATIGVVVDGDAAFRLPDGLSVGHFKNYVPTDTLSRYLRMRGHNVLHPIYETMAESDGHQVVDPVSFDR